MFKWIKKKFNEKKHGVFALQNCNFGYLEIKILQCLNTNII